MCEDILNSCLSLVWKSLAVLPQHHPRSYLGIIHIDFYEHHITILLTQTLERNEKNYAVIVFQESSLKRCIHINWKAGAA